MENRSINNVGKTKSQSKKAVSTRNNGNSALKKKPIIHSAVSQSVGARNIISKTIKPTVQTNARKKSRAVVGMKNHHSSSLRAVRNPKIITVRKKERTPFPIATVFTSVIITVLFLFMMMNYAEIDKSNKQIDDLDSKITGLKNEEANLTIKLDKKDNLIYIEKYATEELGMVKKETLEYKTVNLLPKDKSEIMKYDDGEEGGFGFLLAGVGEVIKDFIK